jgi:molecular chaperone HscB
LSRAEYLLELNDLPMSESDQISDIDFVSQVMETREMIEEGNRKSEILTLMEENDGMHSFWYCPQLCTHVNIARMKETIAEIERLVERRNWPGVKEAAIRLRYLEGIQRAGKKWIDNDV